MSERPAVRSGVVQCRRDADGDERRYWNELNPELLALIFKRLPADELARTMSFVCRGWRDAVAGTYCWSEIDVEEWCRRVNRVDDIDVGVVKLVALSRGSVRRLSAYRIGNWGFSFTAVSGDHLKVLQIPMSDVNDLTLQKYSSFLRALTTLDISYCRRITSKGIEILGKCCMSLANLRRNMSPPQYESTPDNGVAAKINEYEALAVASTMFGIRELEMSFGRFSDYGLHAILTNCKELCSLDIRGCWNVQLEGNVGTRCDALKSFKDAFYDPCDPYELCHVSSDECNEDSADGVDQVI
ncbi:F-box protein FBW2 [Platanthera zijinensis]|uniref:F-box protein FBW2 n=1 Tax=Platanthera zijinensis TaxID=2320716 RepID=A0AAP0G8C6_9ASPA